MQIVFCRTSGECDAERLHGLTMIHHTLYLKTLFEQPSTSESLQRLATTLTVGRCTAIKSN
jgi:hypothetical protein